MHQKHTLLCQYVSFFFTDAYLLVDLLDTFPNYQSGKFFFPPFNEAMINARDVDWK